MKMLRLLPPNIQKTAKGPRILDPIRKQLVPDGPEERVRQSVLWALVHSYGYPASALLSEELVQRGTTNRDRADVLVRLPTGAAKNTFRILPSFEDRVEPAYSAKIQALAERVGPLPPGLRTLMVPDEMNISVDGDTVRCRVLGFAILEGEGHGLALEPRDRTACSPALPPVLGFLVSGYGRTEEEQEVANRLGVRQQEWTHDESLAFTHSVFGVNSDDIAAQVGVELATLSADGRWGQTLLFGHDDDAYGVLVQIDLDECEEDAPEEATAPSPDAPPRLGEADLPVPSSGEIATIAVIECKAPGVLLTKDVENQANRYASKLDAWFVVVTNGLESKVYRRVEGRSPVEISDLPTFEQIRTEGPRVLAALPPELPAPRLPRDVGSRPDCLRFHRRFRSGTVGMSPPETWLPILALDDALRGASAVEGVPFQRHGVSVVEDLGVNARNPGSAVGASWPGLYRDLLIEVGRGERLVLGLSIQGAWDVVDRDRASRHAKHSGWSYMIVATADDGEYEAVLQFAFDKGLRRRGDEWELRHDGRLTAGKGAVRREILFDAIRDRLPSLLADGTVDLGRVPHAASVDVESLRELLARFAVYALVRRAVKRKVKAERRRR